MLNTLLLALPYLFDKDNPLNIPESWNKWLWYIVIGLAALFLLMIIVLFFKALRRSRERREERRIAKEEAAAKKAEEKAAKEEAKRRKKEKPVKRVLTGIALDTTEVQRDFVLGDDFNCDGLLVTANFNVDPLQETIVDYKLVKERAFEKAENGKLDGLHVCLPDMKKAGKKTVRVCYNQQIALYTISVVEKAEELPKEEEKPVVAVVEEQPERILTGITLDATVVQRDFFVGDEFNCDGLLVNANFSVAPVQETFADCTVVDPAIFDKAVSGKLSGIYVCKPDLSKAGKLPVRVCYNQQVALYTISVTEKPVEEPKKEETVAVVAPVVEEKAPERVLTGITLDVGVVERDFHVGDAFNCDGLIVNATFSAAPLQETLANYTVVDAGTFDQAVSGNLSGLYVCRPDLSRSGKLAVRVCFNKQVALYTISVTEKAVEPTPAPVQPVAQPAQPVGPREMISLTVNTDFVRRDFYAGDTLTHDGLIVNAHYNREPFKEQVSNYTVVAPDMSKAGSPMVVVMYQDRATSYPITVRENPYAGQKQQQAAPVVAEPKAVRELQSVTLDTGVVQRDFEVGEEFNCDGLIVNANYSMAPTLEAHADYNIVDARTFDQLTNQTNGCFVAEPDMSSAGRKVVRVSFNKQIAIYTISVHAAKKAEAKEEVKPAVVAAPVAEQPKAVRELLNITLDTGVVQREFAVGEEFNCDGLLVNGNFSLAPTLETYADCTVVDSVSFDQVLHADVNGVYVCEPDTSTAGRKVVRVCLNKHIALYTIVVRAIEKRPDAQTEQQGQPVVVERVVEKIVEVPVEKVVEVPTAQSTQPAQPAPQPVAEPQQTVESPIVIEEESYEATLRYDKSFTARLIQSDKEVKEWYTQLKNKLLSFKTCKGRVSWKRETFKAAKQVVAILAFRGNTMCLFLPLDAGDYADTKYELEDVSNIPAYSETPSMFRLKNNKRIRLAIELIEYVMEERNIPVDLKYISEDFYMPYEGIVELIEKGLVKREIKTAADEAVFTGGQSDDEEDTAVLTEVSRGVYVTSKKAKK